MFVAFSGSRDARDLGAGPFGQIFYTALAKQPSVATASIRTASQPNSVHEASRKRFATFAIRTEIEKVGPVIL